MTGQSDLFTKSDEYRPLARNSDPETSHKAPNRLRLTHDRAAVLEVHKRHPAGLTDFELADLMGRQQTSVGKRRGELVTMGLLEKTNIRRKSPSGSSTIVWKLVPFLPPTAERKGKAAT